MVSEIPNFGDGLDDFLLIYAVEQGRGHLELLMGGTELFINRS